MAASPWREDFIDCGGKPGEQRFQTVSPDSSTIGPINTRIRDEFRLNLFGIAISSNDSHIRLHASPHTLHGAVKGKLIQTTGRVLGDSSQFLELIELNG
jgi:hypothetical protein